MNNIYMVKNFYDYEVINPPPKNLPEGMTTVYLTDGYLNAVEAQLFGWDIVKVINSFSGIYSKEKRRQGIAAVNCFPHRFAPEVLDFDLVFVNDSDLISLWTGYADFVSKCTPDKALFVTSGYYQGARDNMLAECEASMQPRWHYNHLTIREATKRYASDLDDARAVSVVSAKFIGWNLKHKKYNYMSNFLFDEYQLHLQGNITLTYMSEKFKHLIYNHHTHDYSGVQQSAHRFEG